MRILAQGEEKAKAICLVPVELPVAKVRRKLLCTGTFRVSACMILCFLELACALTRLTVPGNNP
jgi:hypothetical protein